MQMMQMTTRERGREGEKEREKGEEEELQKRSAGRIRAKDGETVLVHGWRMLACVSALATLGVWRV
jgi:hypothetical protein